MAFWSASLYDSATMLKTIALSLLVPSLLTNALLPPRAYAQGKPYIPVGTAKTRKTVLAFADIRVAGSPAPSDLARTVRDTFVSDLNFMDLFSFLDRKAFVENSEAGIRPDTFKFTDWSSVGAEFVIKTQLTREPGRIELE
ncbi:MAG: hypothetical protein EBZ67_15390, partial [Chitinophagia bacterium]|nr:hypothetical protein [Chitinophagia bacterium]